MSRFKVGDKVILSSGENWVSGLKYRTVTKAVYDEYRYELDGSYTSHWLECELILYKEPNKTFTIQEVLVDENVGKKFEFNIYKYECKLNSGGKLHLINEYARCIEDEEYLFDILNGTFTLIEEPKPFTEEIDFKEAFKRLCDGEEVKFESESEVCHIFKKVDNNFHVYSNRYKEFSNAGDIKIIINDKYTKYYKK